MSIAPPHKACAALVDALGLTGKRVRSLELRMAVDEPVIITAEMFVTDKELGEVATVLKEYRLVDQAEAIVEVSHLSSKARDWHAR